MISLFGLSYGQPEQMETNNIIPSIHIYGEYLLDTDVDNEANGEMTSFKYNGEHLLYANIIECKGQALL